MRYVTWEPEGGQMVTLHGSGPWEGGGPYFFRRLTSDLGSTAESSRAPRQDGVTTYHVALDGRTINLEGSMLVYGDRLHPADGEYDLARSRLCELFAPNRWGILTYHRTCGAVRVRCRSLATPTISAPVGTYSEIDISFTADSPYWESAEETVEELGVIRKLRRFPWSPVRAPMGTFSPVAVLQNPTAVDIYPTIEVLSTGQRVTVSNLGTGESVTIEHAIDEGQKLVIDMRDVTAILWEKDDTGLWDRKDDVSHWMSLDSTPWCLRPGENRVTISNEAPEETPVAYIRYRVPFLGV